jgi:cobalt-zinc-cadmium efflux system outer membrane protein
MTKSALPSAALPRVRRACLLAAALLLAGCATYTPVPVDPAVTAAAIDSRSLDDPRLQAFMAGMSPDAQAGAPRDLSGLTLAALYFQPDLEIARAKLATAEAAVITAGQRPNPRLGLGPTLHSTLLDSSAWTVGLVVDFVIETFGKRGYRVDLAQDLAEAARLDLSTAAWQVRGRVRTALLAVWAAETRRELTVRRLNLQQQLVDLLERRFSVGEVSALDVTRERIALQQVNLAAHDTDRQTAVARAQLATAIGLPAHALDRRALSFEALDNPVELSLEVAAGALRREALRGRTDIQGLLAEYEAAQAALQLQVASQYPDLTLGPGYTFDQGDNEYALGLGAELPILHQNQGPIAEATARRGEAAARLVGLQARIVGDIDHGLAAYRSAAQTLATADALKAGGERRRQQIERSYRTGDLDRSAVVTAELEAAAIDLARFEVVVQQREALGLLEDALQRPLFDPRAALFMPRGLDRAVIAPES